MWRSFFLAVGITCIILGAECLAIEKAILAPHSKRTNQETLAPAAGPREFAPPEWAPWGLLSGGAVIVLYSFTIPLRVASPGK
ncbi:MAG: hypothetical protein FJ295_03880 [Planctomycetes bacterium]|nr:hypothetical protein [Planctomycetota bacterium]